MDTAATALMAPALALIDSDRRIVRSTDTFRTRYEQAGAACEHSHELELVLHGEANAAFVNAGDVSLAIEAVTDTNGRRHAMLRPAGDDGVAAGDSPISALRDPVDQSPAIAWLKDLDGRYLHVNHRYAADLNTSADRLHGRTDAELPARETVDGPRSQWANDGLQEPLQLEYTIPPYEGRPALVALRFAIRDPQGQAVGVCGVAATINEAQLAREEAARLTQIERWSRMDPAAVRAELLEEWGVGIEPDDARGTDGEGEFHEHWEPPQDQRPEPHADDPPQPEHFEGELDAARARAGQADADAAQAREAAERAREELDALRHQLEELQRASHAQPEPAAHLSDRVEQLQRDLEQARAEREQAREEREQARIEAERARVAAAEARSAAIVAQGELELARSGQAQATAELGDRLRDRERQLESLHAPAALVGGLSADLQRAIASERERGKELSKALEQLVARLAELDQSSDHYYKM